MKITRTHIADLLIIEPRVFEDNRGYFFESFNQQAFEELTTHKRAFVQDNQARSTYGVLRGLHYQNNPHAQAKLVRVIYGAILDIAVDWLIIGYRTKLEVARFLQAILGS